MKNLIAAGLVLASIGIFYFVVIPTYAEIKTLKVVKSGYDEALNHSQEALGLRDAVETKHNNIPVANLNRLEAFLPDSIDNIRLIIEIDKVAGRYNMTLSNAQVVLVGENAPQTIGEASAYTPEMYGTGKLDFAVIGTYEAYVAFLKDIEQSLRLINITNVSLSQAPSAKDSQNVYMYKTTLNTYWLKQ
ncbi:MAG: hypothetical protein WC878_03285 [Candidatus Paceibacterota bacterium]|jgi:hypothetical protein